MVITMYKGSTKCTADTDQISVMQNAGWSREKPAPKKEVPVVVKAKAVEAPVAEADVKVEPSTEPLPKKKYTPPKKRRSAAKK